MKALLLLTALSLAMLGCGGDDATTAGTTDGDPGATASTDLTITVDPGAGGEAVTYSLTCGPAGGDQTAVIEGTLNGEPLRTELSRTNGCEIARWDALQPVLVEPGGVQLD